MKQHLHVKSTKSGTNMTSWLYEQQHIHRSTNITPLFTTHYLHKQVY